MHKRRLVYFLLMRVVTDRGGFVFYRGGWSQTEVGLYFTGEGGHRRMVLFVIEEGGHRQT